MATRVGTNRCKKKSKVFEKIENKSKNDTNGHTECWQVCGEGGTPSAASGDEKPSDRFGKLLGSFSEISYASTK